MDDETNTCIIIVKPDDLLQEESYCRLQLATIKRLATIKPDVVMSFRSATDV